MKNLILIILIVLLFTGSFATSSFSGLTNSACGKICLTTEDPNQPEDPNETEIQEE